MAKDFFKSNDIEFTDHNVAEDTAKRTEMMNMTGQLGVPVIVIRDVQDDEIKAEDIIVGFNEPQVKKLLAIT